MINKHNAAIIILAARIPLLIEVLDKLHKNWNQKFKYPIYIHTFGQLINKTLQEKIETRFDVEIYFCEVQTKFPDHIPEEELYYNRTYLDYVKKSFPKKRSGYLHMCYFKTNITKFGNLGCLDKSLKKYDKLMFYDDDNELKKKINYDLFDFSEKYPIVTGFLTKRKADQEHKDITQNLWDFYYKFIKNNNLVPIDNNLKQAIEDKNPKIIYDLEYTCGALEIYNLNLIRNNYWDNYLDSSNLYGGNYKYRWGDMQVTNLFVRTFFEKPIMDLDYVKNETLNFKIKGSDQFIYHGYRNIYNSKIFNLLVRLKKIIFS